MVSSFPPHSFTIDSSTALHELGEFLYETNKSIERILHRYTLNPPPRKNEIFSDVSVRANSPNSSSSPPPPTVTRSLLPNIGLAMLEHRSTTLNKEDMAQEGSFRDGSSSILRNFMEEILKTSSDWCAKHKLILEGKDLSYMVKSTNPEEHFRMCLNQDRNTEIGDNPKDEIEGSVKAHLNNSSSPPGHDADKCIVNPRCLGGKDEEKPEQRDMLQNSHNPCRNDGENVVNTTKQEQAQTNDDDDNGDDNISQLPMNGFVTPLPLKNVEERAKKLSLVPHESSADLSIQPYRRPVEVIDSPDWLPEGWVTELRIRGTGNSAGSKDKYYIDPDSKRRFRSRKDVLDFIETGKLNRQRKKPGTISPIRKLAEGLSSTPAKQPIKRAKSREDAMPHPSMSPIASSLAINSTPHNTSSSVMGNNMFPPFRTAQPTSEWLMYESLASLPFPVYEPFRYSDANANTNKLSTNKGPQGSSSTTRPWFFTGPDSSWMPFPNIGKPGNNRSTETQNAYSMPPPPPPPSSYSAELATKKGIRKSKKSST